jgi:hypothetical protein
MRIAICFSGQIRTGPRASDNIKHFVGDLYNSCDFFIHTWDLSESKSWLSLSEKYEELKFMPVPYSESGFLATDKLCNSYKNKIVSTRVDNLQYYNNNSALSNVSPLWYSWYQSVILKSEAEQTGNFIYDIVIKLRPDILFPYNTSLSAEIENFLKDTNKFYSIAYAPYESNDVFFISNSKNMDISSKFITSLEPTANWKRDMLYNYLIANNIDVTNTHTSLYAILRDEVEDADLCNFNKCFNIDHDYYSLKDLSRQRLAE